MEKTSNFNFLNIEGTKYRTLLSRKFVNRKNWEKPDDCKIHTFIPGTVLKVFVKEGQVVKKGQKLCILEAMKMRNIILSPHNGTVESVSASIGKPVAKGVELFTISKE